MPILHVLPLIVLYWGIVTILPGSGESITPTNYLPWVLLGSLIISMFVWGYNVFHLRFTSEKYWMTIYGILIAPVSRYYLIFGVFIELSIQALFTSTLFFCICIVVFPTSILNFILVYGIVFLALIAGVGIGLVNGAFYLVNENLTTLFEYALYILSFLSCYSIPYEFYPSFLQIFILSNPLYHFINLGRDLWFMNLNLNSLWSFLYILIFSVVCIIVGVYFFSKLTRKFGVRGY